MVDTNWLNSLPANEPVPPDRATGLVPRNYKALPVGSMVFAQPMPDSEIIDEAEWPERLAENRAKKAGLLDLREANYDILKSLDQDGLGLSHSPDTEVLTEYGWVRWPEYNRRDLLATVNPATHQMEFQAPLEFHGSEYNGLLYCSTNRRLDFAVTNYHRMYVRKWDEQRRTLSDSYSFTLAKDLGWYAGFLHAPSGFVGTELVELEIEGDRRYDGDDLIALLAVVCSDGYAGGSEHTRNRVGFCCFHQDRYEMVKALARRVGAKEQSSRRGVWSIDRVGLARWIRANCYHSSELRAWNKKVPDLIKVASERQIRHFLAFFGDKDHHRPKLQGNRTIPSECYYSTSRRMIDDLQELHLRIGKRSTVCHNDPKAVTFALEGKDPYVSQTRESWTLVVSGTDRLCIDRKKHLETEPYRGLVYCATVPNGTLITRRNGSVLISGNCWAFSSTKAMMYWRILCNLTGLRLSAWWVAGRVVNWQDRGYWGSASLAQIVKEGVPTEALCPSYRSSYDTAETRADAAKRKCTEWWDGSDSPAIATKQLVSQLLRSRPCVVDLNDMGHSMCAIDIASLNPLKIVYDNSWGEGDNKGLYIGQGARARPDGLVIPRSTMVEP